jgi:type VI secretion system protein ImpH
MAAESRAETASVAERLFEDPTRFRFFQAVRLLRRLRRDAPSPGESEDPRREAVRLRSDVGMAFPASDVAEIERAPSDEAPPRLTVSFFGVASPASYGSLPAAYTQFVREEARQRNLATRDFLDLFNHRLIALFYRAWEKHHFPVGYEIAKRPGDALFERTLFSLFGLGAPALRGRLPFLDLALLPWASALARRRVPVETLENMLENVFDVPVRVEQFVPRWHELEPDELTPLGRGRGRLGRDAVIGRTLCVTDSHFRVIMGPLDRASYLRLVPTGDAFSRVRELVRMAVGDELDFDLRLVLRAREVPQLRLGARGESEAPRLGWLTWIGTKPRDRDANDVTIPTSAQPRAAA